MQTSAEKYLIQSLVEFLSTQPEPALIINLGAAKSLVVEKFLELAELKFICDRSDVQDCKVDGDFVGACFTCPLEDMAPIPDNKYSAAFANFVLEHVANPEAATKEMARILKPGGRLIISLSNPIAPEFQLAKYTPTEFHQFFRGAGADDAYPVKYAYGSLEKMIKLLEGSGLKLISEQRFAATYSYLHRFRGLNILSRLYDWIIERSKWRKMMGHACLVFEKK
jgi:SAM-dependent methyltransferase